MDPSIRVPHLSRRGPVWVCLSLLSLALPACESKRKPPDARASALKVGEQKIPAAELDLEGSAAAIREGRVKDGAELERELNRPERSRIDVDHDGKRDPLQVVEHREGDRRVLDVRAIPSSRSKQRPAEVAVPVATILVEPTDGQARVSLRYAETVLVANPVPIVFLTALDPGSFGYWVLLVDRPIFVGSYDVDVVVVRPAPVHVKFKKHKKHKGWK
jgi:hypothetical protein